MGLVSKPRASYGTAVRNHARNCLVAVQIGHVKSRDFCPCILHAYILLPFYALRNPFLLLLSTEYNSRTRSPTHDRLAVPYRVPPPTWTILHLESLQCADIDPCSRTRFCRYAGDFIFGTVHLSMLPLAVWSQEGNVRLGTRSNRVRIEYVRRTSCE